MYTDTIINKIACRIYEFNDMEVEVTDDLDIHQVKIKRGNEIVYAAGSQHDRIGQYHGRVIFNVYYQDSLIAEFGHFNRNNWHAHDYTVLISKEANFSIGYTIEVPNATFGNFQKRYIRDQHNKLVRINFINNKGGVYHTETP